MNFFYFKKITLGSFGTVAKLAAGIFLLFFNKRKGFIRGGCFKRCCSSAFHLYLNLMMFMGIAFIHVLSAFVRPFLFL